MKEYLKKCLKRQCYEAPKAEVIVMESQGVLCASGGGEATGFGAGTTNMNMQGGYGW
jgi:hypothetical protein